MNLVDDGNKLYISALKPNDKQGIVRVSGLAEFAGWKVIVLFLFKIIFILNIILYLIGYWRSQ